MVKELKNLDKCEVSLTSIFDVVMEIEKVEREIELQRALGKDTENLQDYRADLYSLLESENVI